MSWFSSHLRSAAFSVLGIAMGSSAFAQVSVIDVPLNTAITENNSLVTQLMAENQSILTYLNGISYAIGGSENYNVSLEDIAYPSELMTPQFIYKIGFEKTTFNPTSLATPIGVENFLTSTILPKSGETYTQAQKDTFAKYQTIMTRRAVIEGYANAYLARMKAAGTGKFLQKSLRERIIKSSSVREDLAIENLALSEIVGQLGTLVATSASELEITSATALMGISF